MAGSAIVANDDSSDKARRVAEIVRTAGARANRITVTTETLPARHRIGAWNAAFGSLNEIIIPPEAGPDTVVMRSENWRISGMVLSTTQVSTSRFVRDGQRARRDGFDHWVLRVLREGRSHVQHPGFSGWVGPRQPLLFSMHETWATDWHAAAWVTLCIPRDLNPDLSSFLGSLRTGPLPGACAGLLADVLLSLPERVANATEEELPALAEATRATVTACLLAGRPQPAEGIAAVADLEKERVRKAIHHQIGSSRLTPARLAAAAGLSRSALYRLFSDEGGVARYVRDVRLSMAHAALRDPTQRARTISQVAEAHGFPDPSAFSRAFRQAYGATPGDVRAAGWQGPAPARPWPGAPASRTTEDVASLIYRTHGEDGGRERPGPTGTAGTPLRDPRRPAAPARAAAAP